MALRICNVCGSSQYEDNSCAACLAAGRGDIRDYHYDYEADETAASAAPSSAGESVAAGAGEVDTESTTGADDAEVSGDEEDTAEEEAYDASHADDSLTGLTRDELEQHSRNRLSSMAAEHGLDATGTKADLIDRLLGEAQG